jgi:hypothetical protein
MTTTPKSMLSAMVFAVSVAGCSQSSPAANQADMVALRMAATVLEYIATCENRSAPQYYVDKATSIWNGASVSDKRTAKAELNELVAKTADQRVCQVLGMATRLAIAWDFKDQKQPVEAPQPTGLSAKITRIEKSRDDRRVISGIVHTQMIDSTHVKAHRSAAGGKGGGEAGYWPLARRAQHEDSRTCRC